MLILQSTHEIIDQLQFDVEGMLLSAGINYGVKSRKRCNIGIDRWTPGGQPVSRFFPTRFVHGFAANPRSPWIYACAYDSTWPLDEGYGYFAVELTTGRESWLNLRSYAWKCAIDPDGSWLLGFGHEADSSRRVALWGHSEDQPITLLGSRTTLPHLPWSMIGLPNESIISFDAEYSSSSGAWTNRSIGIRSASDGSTLRSLALPDRSFDGFCLSPNRSMLAAKSGSSILIWEHIDRSDGPRLVHAGRMRLTNLAFHPSGRYLAATSNDTTVRLFDTTSWQLAQTYSWNIGRLRSIAFSPDGMLAAAGSDTGRIVVWDVEE